MKRIAKRGLALLMAVLMCMSFLTVAGVHNHAHAADFEYKYSNGTSGYIYNWGTREVIADELSPNAQAFYTGDYTYDKLSQLAGGTGTTDAPNSALYSALKTLMSSKHTYQTSYDATRPLFQYTDCENNGTPNTISSFYSGLAIGPAWDSGSTWNREHTWPNSKGLGGADENDIMMLRPTEKSENGSRGNKAYGESSSFYNPNSVSNGAHDLRGDVARIFLYVYVRWGNVNGNGQYTAWGQSGVMESLDVLTKWMAEDPVDTWELGRNDSVQSITGTRNVFVDYPELAFKLFGKAVPTNTVTPAGGHNLVAGAPTEADCTTGGSTTYTCTCGCGYSYQITVAALGHNYENGTCTRCSAADPNGSGSGEPTIVTDPVAGKAYKLGLYSTNKGKEYYFTGQMSGYYGATDTSYDKGIDVYLEETSGGYYLYFTNSSGTKQYINLVRSGTHKNFTFAAAASTVFNWDADNDALYTTVDTETWYMGTYGTYVTVGVLGSLMSTDYIARLYTLGGSSGDGSGSNPGGGEGSDPAPGENVTVTTVIADYADANGWTNGTQYPTVNMDDVVTVTASGGQNTGKYYTSGENWRMYQTETPSIVVSAGDKTIISVKITYKVEKGGALTYNGANVASDDVVEVNASSITFGVGNTGSATNGQARITAIEVVYGDGTSGGNPGGGEGDGEGEGTEPESRTVRIYYPKGNNYMTATASGNKLKPGNTERAGAIWTMTAEGEYYTFSCDGKYLTSGATGNSLTLSANLTDYALWALEEATDGYYLRNKAAAYSGKSQYVEYYNNLFTTYGFNSSNKAIYTFQLKDAVTPDKCTHDWDAATCTEPKTCKICYTTEGDALGHDWADATCTAPKTCSVCSTTSGSALGHSYESGACTVCGAEDPNKGLTVADITFDNTSKRTVFNTSKQVWEENGITVTNNKAASTSSVANYSNPARFYAASELIIEYPGMLKIEVTCNSSSYATALKNSIPANSATVTVSGKVVTITLSAAADSFKVARLSAQVRVNSITVYAECQHAEWYEATCTSPKTCKNCGEADGAALGHDYLALMTTKATCEKDGTQLYKCTNGCGDFIEIKVKATGHKMVDGTCTACGLTEEVVVIDPVTTCGGSDECPLHTFSDLSADGWYHHGIHYCVSNGLIQGLPGNKYAPNETVTRAQIITILWRMAGSPVVNYAMDFTDVANGQWYTEAIRWAASQELMEGIVSGEFGINDVITREQFALVLYRFALCDGQYVTIDGDLDYFFDDAAEVSSYAVRAMEWAFGEGLIQGVSDTKIDPAGSVTRAQAATILYRYIQNVVE